MASFPSVYRARAVHINGAAIDVFVPQVFGETAIVVSEYLGGPPEEPGMGWVVFQGGNPEFPVWAGNLASGGTGGTGGGTDEVWVGPSEPTIPTIELWLDTDAIPDMDATNLATHLTDPGDAHDASSISLIPTGTISSTNVQDAIAEIAAEEAVRITNHGELTGLLDDDHPQYAKGIDLAAHITDTVDAHDASAISFVPGGGVAATNVQAAIAELAAEALDYVPKLTPFTIQNATAYTFALTDIGATVLHNNALAITATVPPNSAVAFPLGSRIDNAQLGAGQVTFAQGAGVNIRVPTALGLKIKGQYGEASLTKIATDEWLLAGYVSS